MPPPPRWQKACARPEDTCGHVDGSCTAKGGGGEEQEEEQEEEGG